jgi:hypothetical protein
MGRLVMVAVEFCWRRIASEAAGIAHLLSSEAKVGTKDIGGLREELWQRGSNPAEVTFDFDGVEVLL